MELRAVHLQMELRAVRNILNAHTLVLCDNVMLVYNILSL